MTNPQKIKIDLPYGTLIAEEGKDYDYPSISIYLERLDGTVIDLITIDYTNCIEKLSPAMIRRLVSYYECDIANGSGEVEDTVCIRGTVMPTVEEANKFLREQFPCKHHKVCKITEITAEEAQAKYGRHVWYLPIFERKAYRELTAYIWDDIHSEEYKRTAHWPMQDILELEVD